MSKKWKSLLIGLLVLLLGVPGYVAYIYVRAGELKSIEPHFAGSCRRVAGAVGAEDITIHPDSAVAYVASDDRRATLAGRPVPGAIFAYDLASPRAAPRAT